MHVLNMYMRDAREGIQRNAGAAATAAALIFAAMLILGGLLLVRIGITDIMSYVQAQVNIKVYVDPAIDTREVARILESKSFVKSVDIEKKEQLLERLRVFFQGKEYLLNAFKDSAIPDAVTIKLSDNNSIEQIVKELRTMKGIAEVVYPQQLAETVVKWSEQGKRYGVILLTVCTAIAFVTVYMAINLALYQRQKEIRVKLLLGAKPAHVRGQFLLEGGLIGLIGSLLASATIYMGYAYMLFPIERYYPYIFHFPVSQVYSLMAVLLAVGTLVGLAASYVSTMKLIKDA
jgi:cell division transport system permease protein